MSGLGVMRCAFSSSLMLLPCRSPLAHEKNVLADSLLPPDFGTMFITGPPDSTSPRLPEVVKLTSCELRGSVR